MKKLLHMSVTVLLIGLFILSTAATAFAGGMENEDYGNKFQNVREGTPADEEWETVEKLVLLSRSGDYVFTGEDADENGSVTMEVGNTYNFVLEKSVTNGWLEGTGIVLRANENATYLPLDNEGTYAVVDYTVPVTERVEFIDVSLNTNAKNEEMDYYVKRSPAFSISGKVICTLSFVVSSVYHVGDGNITIEDELNHYTYLNGAQPLETELLATYTITIDGTSNGIYADYLYDEDLMAASGIGYNKNISGASGDAVYTIDIEVDGETLHYDLKDPDERIKWLSVDIKFDICDWSLMTVKNENHINYAEEHGEEHHIAQHHQSGFSRAVRYTAVAVFGAVLGLLGCAASNALTGAAGAVSGVTAEAGFGENQEESSPELPKEDTEGVSVELDVTFSDLINEKGAAVTIPISVSGGEREEWHYIVNTVCKDAPKAVVPSAAGDNAVLALTGDLNGLKELDVALFVTAWSRRADGTIQKASAAEELTIHSEGIKAEVQDGKLKVTLYTPSRIKGAAEITELSEADYETADGVIRTKKAPHYTCNMPEM